MIALDTNLLIYAHRAGTPKHRGARAAIERAASDATGWGIALPCLSEFWCIVTHPACEGGPSRAKDALAFLDALMAGGAKIWYPGFDFGPRFMELAKALNVSGVRVFDLQIAAVAFENGAKEIWTHDREFVALPGLRVHDPL